MKWLELKLDTSPAGLDPVSQLLEEQGITGLVIDDEGDFRDFLEHNHQYWDYVDEELMQEKQGLCRITFYLSDDPEGYHRLAQVRMASRLPVLPSRSKSIPTELTSSFLDSRASTEPRMELSFSSLMS